MRVRSVDPSARAVGFGGAGKRQATQIRQAQTGYTKRQLYAQSAVQGQRTSRRQLNASKSDNFGLSVAESREKARLKASRDFLKPVSTLEFDLSSKELKPDYSLRRREVADTPSKHGKKKMKKKMGKAKKIIIGIVIILVLVGGGFAIWGDRLIAKLTGGQSGIFELIGAITSNVKLKTDKNGRTNILVFGTSGYDMDGTIVAGEQHDGAQLTDSIMMISLDQETKDVAMVSLPRDLYVGNTCTSTGKVNEVYFCSNLYGNDEAGGAEALKNTVEEIFDVDIQYRIHVDWSALIQIVNGLGSITVTLDNDIEDPWTGTFITAGNPVELNGEQALGLARARHGTTMGDFTRGDSQQKILAAIQRRIIDKGLDLGSSLNLVEAVGDNVRMDFSLDEMKTIFSIAKEISLESMRQIPLIDYEKGIYYLSTADMNGISYVVPTAGAKDYKDIQKYVHKMISSNPAVREDAMILVLNGTGKSGVAMNEQTKLNNEGYPNVEIGDAPEGEYVEKYYLYDLSGAAPGTLEQLKQKYGVDVRPKEELPAGTDTKNADIVIIIGNTDSAE